MSRNLVVAVLLSSSARCSGYVLKTLPLTSRHSMSSALFSAQGAVDPEGAVGPSSRLRRHEEAFSLHSTLELHSKLDTSLGVALKHALQTLADALRLYGPEALVTSFNGGKDAIVVLHLMRASLAAHTERSGKAARLPAIFFEVTDEFPEVRGEEIGTHGASVLFCLDCW